MSRKNLAEANPGTPKVNAAETVTSAFGNNYLKYRGATIPQCAEAWELYTASEERGGLCERAAELLTTAIKVSVDMILDSPRSVPTSDVLNAAYAHFTSVAECDAVCEAGGCDTEPLASARHALRQVGGDPDWC